MTDREPADESVDETGPGSSTVKASPGKARTRRRFARRKGEATGALGAEPSAEAESAEQAHEDPTPSATKGTSAEKRTRLRRRSGGSAKAGTRSGGAVDSTGAKGKSGRRVAGLLADGRRLAHISTALAVVAALLAVTLVVQLFRGSDAASGVEAREDKREAARQAADLAVARLFSFDYQKLDADFAAQREVTTGDFTGEIDKVTNPAVRPLAAQQHVVVQAVSLGSAVVEDRGNDVDVLVYLNQAVKLDLLPAPRLDRNRLIATMRLVDGRWKVAGIKAL